MKELLTPSLNAIDSKFLKLFNPPCSQIQTISYTDSTVKAKSTKEEDKNQIGKNSNNVSQKNPCALAKPTEGDITSNGFLFHSKCLIF